MTTLKKIGFVLCIAVVAAMTVAGSVETAVAGGTEVGNGLISEGMGPAAGNEWAPKCDWDAEVDNGMVSTRCSGTEIGNG